MNGSLPVSHLLRGFGEIPIGMVEEFARLHVLVGTHQAPELAAIASQRPIFERFGVAGRPSKPPARPISPSKPSWSAKPSFTVFCEGGWPVL